MNILYKDKFIVVAEKPANMPSQDDKTGDLSAQATVSAYAIINRLDRGVGGLIVFALDEKSASNLSAQLKSDFCKHYLAVVCGMPQLETAKLTDFLLKNERTNTSKIVPQTQQGAKKAMLGYNVLKTFHTETFGHLSLLNINLITGRHHQIRIQLSNCGLPLWGDTKYNKHFGKGGKFYKTALNEDITITPALWSSSLKFKHPSSHETVTFTSLPKSYPFTLFPLQHVLLSPPEE